MLNFPVQLTTGRSGNLTRLIHTLLYVMTIHTYILYVFIIVDSYRGRAGEVSSYTERISHEHVNITVISRKIRARWLQ